MSKKNSNVILKNYFKDFKELHEIYLKFKIKLKNFKKKTFVVAVSGGPDSLALVALTKSLHYENKTKFFYVLINHNIRKKSSQEAIKVKKLLFKKKINLNIVSNQQLIKKNIQSEARNIRYNLLLKFCKKKKINNLITAHNLEDQVETFFIRLSRGSGLTGLSSMKPIYKIKPNINLHRPLLDIKKVHLIKISRLIFGKFISDPTNTDTKFLRPKIRNLKKPLEASGIEYTQIIKSIKHLASSKETLEKYFTKEYKNVVQNSRNNLIIIDMNRFKKLNQEMKIKVINASIKKLKNNYYNPRSKKVINLINKLENKAGNKFTLGGCIFIKNSEKLTLTKERP